MSSKNRPFVIYVAEVIYKEISEIKKNNPKISNIDAIEGFIGSKKYNEISSGEFHNIWLKELKKNGYVDKDSGEKINEETIKILKMQRDITIKQLIKLPDLYYAKSRFPLEISQRAFDHLWRMCESYELWCKESKQNKLIVLSIID